MGARRIPRAGWPWCAVGLAAALIGASICPEPAAAGPSDGPVRLGLSLHIPERDGKPVADNAFIARQIATANEIFAPYGVEFAEVERRAIPGKHGRMEDRADRNALGALVRPRAINVFVVTSLRDVDDPSRMRRGVHWRSRTHEPAHFVILSAISFDAVLAHELGHFLGNHRHSQTPGNLMSYQHTDVLPFLDKPQQRRLRHSLERYLRRGELVRIPKAKGN